VARWLKNIFGQTSIFVAKHSSAVVWSRLSQYGGTKEKTVREHKNDGSCCAGEPAIRLQRDLYNRMRNRPYYFSDRYARAFSDYEGEVLPVVHRFPASFCVRFPDGVARDCPLLFCDPL
jgi:hypothetical protein